MCIEERDSFDWNWCVNCVKKIQFVIADEQNIDKWKMKNKKRTKQKENTKWKMQDSSFWFYFVFFLVPLFLLFSSYASHTIILFLWIFRYFSSFLILNIFVLTVSSFFSSCLTFLFFFCFLFRKIN